MGRSRYGRLNRRSIARKLATSRSSAASSVRSKKGTVAPGLLAFLHDRASARDESESEISTPRHKELVHVDAEILRGKNQHGLPVEPQTNKEMDL